MIRKFFSKKIVIILLIQIMMLLWFSISIQNFSIDIKYPVAPWVCVFYFINPFFAMVWQICIIFFFSDAPFLQYKEMYRMIRLGRKRWFWKMQGYVVGSSVALFFVEAGLSIFLLLPCGIDWTWDWGRVLYTLAMTNVKTEYSLLAMFPYTLMLEYTALEAMTLLAIISISLNIMTAEVIAIAGLLKGHAMGMGLVFGAALYVVAERNLSREMPEILYFSPYSWLNLNRIGMNSGYQITLLYVLVFLATGGLVLLICWEYIYLKSDLLWKKED